MKRLAWYATAGAAALLAACGSEDEGPCDLAAQTGCDEGQVCAAVEGGGDPICTGPVYLEGRVIDLAVDTGIASAQVVALDVNRAPASRVAESASDGAYRLEVPALRGADGTPLAAQVTLRADAAGFQSFPSGLRDALPIELGQAVKGDDGAWRIQNSQTDVGLLGLPAGSGTGVIKGKVAVPPERVGVIVVAETGAVDARKGYDAVADRDGSYTIFNVPAGDFDVSAYARHHVYTPAQVSLQGGATATADLALTDGAGAQLDGMVSIVDGGGASLTSVVLFVESTFDATIVRGAAVPGLRAPDPGIAPNISTAFSIAGVPPGRYVAMAAFEDDGLVRDPDSCIAGTDIVHVEVPATGVVQAGEFKVTGALRMLSPEKGAAVTGAPTFSWSDDSSEDQYRVVVRDSFGREVWNHEITGVSGSTPTLTYAGDPLQPGMYYQVRVTSSRLGGGQVPRRCEISTTEDLAGVFYVP